MQSRPNTLQPGLIGICLTILLVVLILGFSRYVEIRGFKRRGVTKNPKGAIFLQPNFSPRNSSDSSSHQNIFGGRTSEFCKLIKENPKPYNACKMEKDSKLCPDGSATMFSQFFQDYYLYIKHFSKLKRRGFYVDLASNHPWSISNSYFMDACLQWNGICIEANPEYIQGLKKERSCEIVEKCISENNHETVSFVLSGGYSGISETNKFMESWRRDGAELNEIKLNCSTLGKVFRENNVMVVDYLSLDVEGHELSILKGINWKKVQINVLTIEVSQRTRLAIERFMIKRGYVRHIPTYSEETKTTGYLKEDGIYIRDDVTFGAPV